MAFVYNPKVEHGATSYSLPQPILKWDISYPRKATFHKVPLANGQNVYGHTKEPIKISVEGIVYGDTPTSVLNELADMETFFDSYDNNFYLYRYYDNATGGAEYYKECVLLNMKTPRTNKPLVVAPYSLDIQAMDTTRYTSASAGSGDETINGELVVNLQDTVGVKAVRVNDSDGTTVARIDSNGNMLLKGALTSLFRGTIT